MSYSLVTKREIRNMRRLYLKHQNVHKVAKKVGRANGTVWKYVRDLIKEKITKENAEKEQVIQKIRELPDKEAGYIAGIIDGEGSLTIHPVPRSERRGGVGLYPEVIITNTNLSLFEFLQERVGGRLYKRLKHCPVLKLYQPDVITALLERIIDSLVIKKKHAELMLGFLRIESQRKPGEPNTAEQFELARKLRELNGGENNGD